MEIMYEKYYRVPYCSIEADIYYSFDNTDWIRVPYAHDFIFNASLVGADGYLSVLHCGNHDVLSQLIESSQPFNLKVEFRVDGAGDPKDPICFEGVMVTEHGMECYSMNTDTKDVVRKMKFKANKCQIG